MATIKVNSTSMRTKANTFNAIARDINGFTTEMSSEINRLRSFWTGDAGETLANKFNALKDDFENIVDTINSYARFLNEAADAYDEAENTNLRGAQGQRS